MAANVQAFRLGRLAVADPGRLRRPVGAAGRRPGAGVEPSEADHRDVVVLGPPVGVLADRLHLKLYEAIERLTERGVLQKVRYRLIAGVECTA